MGKHHRYERRKKTLTRTQKWHTMFIEGLILVRASQMCLVDGGYYSILAKPFQQYI